MPTLWFRWRVRLLKTWRFRFYEASMLGCPKCHDVFNYCHGVNPTGKRSDFVIKLRPRVR